MCPEVTLKLLWKTNDAARNIPVSIQEGEDMPARLWHEYGGVGMNLAYSEGKALGAGANLYKLRGT